jgi:hypothetical protein
MVKIEKEVELEAGTKARHIEQDELPDIPRRSRKIIESVGEITSTQKTTDDELLTLGPIWTLSTFKEIRDSLKAVIEADLVIAVSNDGDERSIYSCQMENIGE